MRTIRRSAVVLPLALIGGTLALSAPALASGGGGDVRAAGTCSAASTWKLKAKPDDGRIQVEFEVDSNVVGQTWTWRLLDNTVGVASGTATTVAPSGSFTVERRIANRAGVDTIRFRSTNTRSGEVCTGVVRL